MIGPIVAFCRAYAEHVGLPDPPGGFPGEIERRLALWPSWARWSAGLTAWALTWLAPAALLGRASRFDGLSPERKDALLDLLQQTGAPLVRGAFLTLKAVVLGACYGAPTPR